MSEDTCAEDLRRVLDDRDFLQAARREHATAVATAVQRLQLDGFVRLWLLGHAAELAGDLAQAGEHYAQAVAVAARHACPAAAALSGWLQLNLQAVRARLGDAGPGATIDHPVVPPITPSTTEASNYAALLSAQLATARALIVLDRPGVTPARHELQQLTAALDRATIAAEAAIAATGGWTRITTAEPFGQLFMQAFRALMRGHLTGASPDGRDRAWAWFRALRQSLDLLPTEPAGPSSIPADTTVVELLALPGDPLHVCLSGPWGRDFARSATTVEEAARLQYDLGERLRAICAPSTGATSGIAPAATADTVVALSEWTYDSATAWSALLANRPMTWSGGAVMSLHDRLVATHAVRLCILPHGPVYMAPWALLCSASGTAWIDTWAITVCASWRSPPVDRDPAAAGWVVDKQLPLATAIDAIAPSPQDATPLFREIAGAGRAWISGHGLFLPPTHGDSRIVTLGTKILDFGLSALIDTACRVHATRLHAPPSVMLSICEAGEVSRRSFLTEFITLAHAFLVAGAASVVAPKWSTTNLCDADLPAWLAQPRPLATLAHDMLLAAYARWRGCPDRRDVEALTRTCMADRSLPLCDIGAFDVHGYI